MRILILLLISCTAIGQTGSIVVSTTSVPKVTVFNNVAMLSFTGVNVGSYQWAITPTTSAAYIYGGSDYASKIVNLKSGIKYTFTLTTWDKAGGAPQTATVVYDNSVPIVAPITRKDSSYQIVIFDSTGTKRWTVTTIFKDGTGVTTKQ